MVPNYDQTPCRMPLVPRPCIADNERAKANRGNPYVRALIIAAAIVLAACAPAPTPQTTPAAPGAITIEQPAAEAVIDAEVVSIAGTAAGVGWFSVALYGPDDSRIAAGIVVPVDGAWSIDLLHGYRGAVGSGQIRAETPDATYAAIPITWMLDREGGQ